MKPALTALLGSALTAAALGAESAPAVNETPIELPKFVVTDSRELPPPESWRYATMPGFEILSNASDRATQRLIRDFDMFRQALGQVWPVQNRVTASCYLIICGRGAKFDAFEPEKKNDAETARASLFLKQGAQTAIVIDFQATTLNVLNSDDSNDAATGTDSGVISVEHDKQLYREYVHYLLSRAEPRMPAWFEEGLAQIVMRMQFDKRWIEFAKLEDPNTVSAQAGMVMELNAAAAAAGEDADGTTVPSAPAEDRDFNVALQRRALVPLDQFFAVAHDAPEAINPLGNNRWAKQAYAFVHMCLYGYKGKYQKAFAAFLVRAAREPVTEEMFKDCFKMSYKEMLLQLRSYCDFTVYDSREYRAKEDVILPPPPLALRDATPAEIGRIKGETLVLAGHPQAARTELIAPYIRGERDPQLLAALGLEERAAGQDERARKFLEAAVAQKVVRPDAYLEVARWRFADAVAANASSDGRFNAAQVKSVIDPLLVARTQPPPLPAVYELMADTWMRSATPPTREQITPVVAGAQQNPTRLKLAYQAAALSAQAGWLEAAHAFADHGVKYAPDPAVKARFAQLKAALPPLPPEKAAAAAPAAAAPKR